MGFHQQAGNTQTCAVAMRQARVVFQPIRKGLDMVAAECKALDGLLLQVQFGLAQEGMVGAADLKAVGIVLIPAVPIVRIHDQGGAENGQQMRHGACFGLRKQSPIAVEVGMNGVFACAELGTVRVDHWDKVQCDTVQFGAKSGGFAVGNTVDQT